MKFTKMEGCGNDYIYINCFEETVENPEEMAIKMSDRHFGVGADGLVLICPDNKANFKMRMFNADGSEAEMCGNAARCVAKYVYEKGLTSKSEIKLNTLAGIKNIVLNVNNKIVESITIDMGMPVISEKINLVEEIGDTCCVSMGNPHAVSFVENTDSFDVEKYGVEIENNSYFPDKTNAEFVEIIDKNNIKMRVWERGSGETLACGTGACASAVACAVIGLTERKVNVHLLGGKLSVEWNEEDNHVYLTGPAKFCFEGIWLK